MRLAPLLAPRSSSRAGVVSRAPRPRRKRRDAPVPAAPRSLRPIAALRVAAIGGLFASALLTADALRGGRGFCPLEEACSKARESALGHVLGVPTAVMGLAAFVALLGLTLTASRPARALLRPAGWSAGVVGLALLGYQALSLGSFCPFCVVADSAGLAAGVLVVAAPRGLRLAPADGRRSRALWALVAAVALAGPLVWPRPAEPPWIPVPAAAWRPADEVPVPTVIGVESPPLPAELAPAAAPVPQEAAVPVRVEIAIEPATVLESAPVAPEPGAPASPEPAAVPLAPPPAPASPSPDPLAAGAPVPPPAAVPAAPAPEPVSPPVRGPSAGDAVAAPTAELAEPEVVLVEYVNAFCPHCRATHARLDRALAGARVRRHRVYTWGGAATPLWAQACVCAAAFGKEDPLFEELLRADDDGADAVWAAASRVGIDARALWTAVARGDAVPRLDADRRRADASQVHRLPTVDVGARRLEGESSEADLRAAIQAAREAANGGRR